MHWPRSMRSPTVPLPLSPSPYCRQTGACNLRYIIIYDFPGPLRMGGCRCLLALCIALVGSTLAAAASANKSGNGAGSGGGGASTATEREARNGGSLEDFGHFKSNRFQSLVRTAVAAASEADPAVLGADKRNGRCRSSEFHCKNTNFCIPVSKYCDRKIDCPDKSDEPASCTGEWTATVINCYNL